MATCASGMTTCAPGWHPLIAAVSVRPQVAETIDGATRVAVRCAVGGMAGLCGMGLIADDDSRIGDDSLAGGDPVPGIIRKQGF